MAQHREAPAFQEYAASMMARIDYRVMSLEGRGLLYTMRLECWVNATVPSNPDLLARVLSFPADQVSRALAEVRVFFVDDNGTFRCPELDNYRKHLEDIRQRQSQGGRAGADKTNKVRGRPSTGKPSGNPQVGRESLVKNSQVQPNKEKVLNGAVIQDPWLNDYEQASKGH